MEPLGIDDPVRIAGYRLVAVLGEGGMGRVYLARSPGGRPVAVKVIRTELADDAGFRDRFVREVSAARSVSGVFTAAVLDADPHGDPPWLATGYVAGISLGEAVARFGPLPASAVRTLAAGLSEALVAVHAAGLVHRDVKPSNIMLSADGPKLIDFGIARVAAAAVGSDHTRAGVVLGSPAFLAPEQITRSAVGPAADLFAFGSVLVFAATGRAPFGGGDQLAALYQVVHGEPDLDGVPEPIRDVVARCLAKDPAQRPRPRELIDAVDAQAADWHLPAALGRAIMDRSAALLAPAPTTPPRPAPPHPRARRYGVGIDLGTTYTAAAVWQDGVASSVPLGGRSHSVPSVLFLPGGPEVIIGETAVRRGIADPDGVAREFKRRFGDATPLLVGDREITAVELTSRLLRWVVAAVAEREGPAPAHVTLTHPATWGKHRQGLLVEAAASAGLPGVGLLPEPVAAAAYYASAHRLATGDLLAVYDLGGGTFDAAVVRKTPTAFAILGEPAGDDRLGGVDFDEVVLDHVARSLGVAWSDFDITDPATLAGLAQVREHVTAAKEALSTDVEADVPVILPGLATQVRITRPEFENAVRGSLQRTVDLLGRAIASAGVEPADVRAALLIGGSSRIPLVSRLISSTLRLPVAVDAQPKYATCLGAAIAAGARLGVGAGGPARGPVATPVPSLGGEGTRLVVDLARTGILTRLDATGPTVATASEPSAVSATGAGTSADAAVETSMITASGAPEPTGATVGPPAVGTVGVPVTDAAPAVPPAPDESDATSLIAPPPDAPTAGGPPSPTGSTDPGDPRAAGPPAAPRRRRWLLVGLAVLLASIAVGVGSQLARSTYGGGSGEIVFTSGPAPAGCPLAIDDLERLTGEQWYAYSGMSESPGTFSCWYYIVATTQTGGVVGYLNTVTASTPATAATLREGFVTSCPDEPQPSGDGFICAMRTGVLAGGIERDGSAVLLALSSEDSRLEAGFPAVLQAVRP